MNHTDELDETQPSRAGDLGLEANRTVKRSFRLFYWSVITLTIVVTIFVTISKSRMVIRCEVWSSTCRQVCGWRTLGTKKYKQTEQERQSFKTEVHKFLRLLCSRCRLENITCTRKQLTRYLYCIRSSQYHQSSKFHPPRFHDSVRGKTKSVRARFTRWIYGKQEAIKWNFPHSNAI